MEGIGASLADPRGPRRTRATARPHGMDRRAASSVQAHPVQRCNALPSALAFLATLAIAPGVSAQAASIHATSDALYIGARAEPGGAWSFAYDLDILVSDPQSGVSLGPSISIAFGGTSSTDLGRRQEYLLTADFLRGRVTIWQGYGFRGMALVGAGMTLASLYDQTSLPHDAWLADGTSVVVTDHHPYALVPGAILTLGLGADWYFTSQWGLCAYLVGHIRLDEQPRMPALWVELGVGFRFGE
jgi:hypothetical protein